MTDTYTLDEIHEEIAEIYHWWARNAPGVTPLEDGRLGALWALHDLMIEEEPWTTDQTS